MCQKRIITFQLGGMVFEYDEEKNQKNIQKHGISFKNAARVFFDYDRIELYDEEHSDVEDRYDTIGDTSAGNSMQTDVTRLISARLATSFERGIYYGKYE